jgi:hypothetical protein
MARWLADPEDLYSLEAPVEDLQHLARAYLELEEKLEVLDDALRDILDVTEKWTRQMSDVERLQNIEWRAKAALKATSNKTTEMEILE